MAIHAPQLAVRSFVPSFNMTLHQEYCQAQTLAQLSQLHIRYCDCLREISRRRCLRYDKLPLNTSGKVSLLDEDGLLGWRAISPYFLKKRRWVTQECNRLDTEKQTISNSLSRPNCSSFHPFTPFSLPTRSLLAVKADFQLCRFVRRSSASDSSPAGLTQGPSAGSCNPRAMNMSSALKTSLVA